MNSPPLPDAHDSLSKRISVFLFSNEHDPAHVHVEKGDGAANFNLIPVTLVKNEGMKPKELKQSEALIEVNQGLFLQKWNQYFGR